MRMLTLALLLIAAPAAAQQQIDPDKITIEAEAAGPGVHVLYGAGGNMALGHGADGVFLVDDQFAPLSPKIMAKIREIAGRDVRFLVNTHWHYDHTGGNENFGKAGTLIVAHDNVRVRMATEQRRGDRVTPPSPPPALPVITFDSTNSFHINGDTVRAIHVPHAHTDGDALIRFEKANVLHMGDTFFNMNTFPFIDLASGGSIRGLIAAIDRGLELSDDATRIIPGHGKMTDRKALAGYRAMLADVTTKVERLKTEGQPRDAIIAAKPAAAYEAGRTGGFISADAFVGTVFDSLSAPATHAH
jgi:cyclase